MSIGPYSPATRAGDFVILSGQLGMVPEADTPTIIAGGAPEELRQALKNAEGLLNRHGATMSQVVKGTLFLMDLADFTACNEVWMEAFAEPRPTRSTIQIAGLPLGARAEAELWAFAPLS
ncbi:MAG TPA: Rid family hydrolase [Acidimicrobiales bacterium]